jgi:rod shape-determining protein MreD
MTLLAPGGRRDRAQPSERPIVMVGAAHPAIGLALAPPPLPDETDTSGPARLGGAALLGAALVLVVGLLLQRTVLPHLPWGPADLVTALVAALALYAGPAIGCVAGFGIGLAADLLSDHALGRLAAALCLVGYLCGLPSVQGRLRMLVAWLTIAAACVVTPLSFALTGAFVGDTRAAGMLLVTRCVAGLGYGLILAPFVYPLTRRLLGPRDRQRARRRGDAARSRALP